jgi:hypothetical protein
MFFRRLLSSNDRVQLMRKKIELKKQTMRRLDRTGIATARGGMQADDGTNSGYPVCRTYYYCPQPAPPTDWDTYV